MTALTAAPGKVEIRTTDESGEHVVATAGPFEVEGDHYVDVYVDEPLAPQAARELAAALVRLADAADARQ